MKRWILLMLLVPVISPAQDTQTPQASTPQTQTPPPGPPSCEAEEHRQFDFWVGDWAVYAGDNLAGHNRIRRAHNDCVITENWNSTSAYAGSSFNLYDRATQRWHQTWVDTSGGLLLLDGGLVDGSMVLSGQRPAADGSGQVTHRISWTPNEDGSVRQLWEASRDGQEWSVLFDGLYKKKAAD